MSLKKVTKALVLKHTIRGGIYPVPNVPNVLDDAGEILTAGVDTYAVYPASGQGYRVNCPDFTAMIIEATDVADPIIRVNPETPFQTASVEVVERPEKRAEAPTTTSAGV